MGKVWRNGGEEDKYIKKLIQKGKINKFTKPSKLKAENPQMFGEFTMGVIRNHLNSLKLSHGLLLDGESDDDIEEVVDNQEEIVTVVGEHASAKTLDDIASGFQHIVHRNYPVLCELYEEPESACSKVALVICLPAGAQNVTIELSDDGASATVKYKWPKAMYDMRELYSNMLAANQINYHHPRILSIKNGLEKCRQRNDEAPEAAIKVMFPMKVQTGGDTWSMSGVKKADGTQILMADFTGFIQNYSAKIRGVRFE